MKIKNTIVITLVLMVGTAKADWFSNLTNWAYNNPKTSLVITATAMLAAAYWFFKPKAGSGAGGKPSAGPTIGPDGISRIVSNAVNPAEGWTHTWSKTSDVPNNLDQAFREDDSDEDNDLDTGFNTSSILDQID